MKEVFDFLKDTYNFFNNNREFITLIVTIIVALISLISTYITRKMLILSSLPSLKIDTKGIHINPDIIEEPHYLNINRVVKDDTRYWFNLIIKITNIGNNIAQNICLDGYVTFIKRHPQGYTTLPIHLPNFYNLIPSVNMEGGYIDTNVCFDNFVAREIIKDFYESYKYEKLFPTLPTSKELRDKRFWHSPKIVINCFYSDIQGNHYCTSQEIYFHMSYDKDNKKVNISLLNMFDMDFQKVRKITKRYREKYFYNIRHLRYTAFDGQKYKKNTLHCYQIVKKKGNDNTTRLRKKISDMFRSLKLKK